MAVALDVQEDSAPHIGSVDWPTLRGFNFRQRQVWEAMFAFRNPLVLGGGSGYGGKSYMLRACAVGFALWLYSMGFERIPILFASSTYEVLRDRHFAYFNQEFGELGEITLSDREWGRCFRFHNKNIGPIVLRNLSDPNERKGTEFGAAFIDELTEILKETFGAVRYMVRSPKVPTRPIVGATNPDGVGHAWVKSYWRPDLYGDAEMAPVTLQGLLAHPSRVKKFDRLTDPLGKLKPQQFVYVPFRPDDNPMFDEETFWGMVADLPEHVQIARRYGRWDAPEGAVFGYLRAADQVYDPAEAFPAGIPESWPKLLHLDYGLRAPYCALWTAIDQDGDPWTYREDYRAGLTAPEQAARIMELMAEQEKLYAGYADPAIWQKLPGHLGKAHEAANLSVADMYHEVWRGDPRFPVLEPGYNKSRIIALGTLHKLLKRDNGFPDWHISMECAALWRELTGAVYPKGTPAKDVTEDLDPSSPDHAITASYYGLHTHLKLPARPPKPEIRPEDYAAAREAAISKSEQKAFKQHVRRTTR